MLKSNPVNGQTYERIKNAIATPQFRKPPILERMATKTRVQVTPTPSDNIDFNCRSLFDLKQSEKESKILKTLRVLQRTRFTWERNPIQVLKEKLEVAGLNLDVF